MADESKSDFQFCSVCRRHHNQGRKHTYSRKHCYNTREIVIKYGKKINEARRTINSPSVINGELEPGSKFWCHFCHSEVNKHVTDGETSIEFGGVFEHLANSDHMKHTNKWWTDNAAEKSEKSKFLLSRHELHRFKECVRDKIEALQNEVGTNYDKSVLAIQEQEKRQKLIAAQPPEPCSPAVIVHRTVKNRYGVMQNPTGFHDGQRVWGGGVVKYSTRSDQWYPWEFDFDDGRRTTRVHPSSSTLSGNAYNKEITEGEIAHNVHTGATPPWLLSEDDKATSSVVIGPSFEEFQKHVERSKKRVKNPNRVGANFDRKSEVNSDWLPSFGGVWNAGPRWQTRRGFKSRREKRK